MRTVRAVVAAILAGGLGLGPAAGEQGTMGPVPPPSYYRPVVVEGMTFPVARTNWFSVIEFARDWHDPRFRLLGGRWRLVGVHEGLDIVAERETPVLSMADGTVERLGWTFYSGTRVGVRGNDGRYYFYAHLSGVSRGIGVGTRVRAGTVLGSVGNTGYGPPGHRDEFPPHLHLGIQEGTEWVDPYPTVRRLYAISTRETVRGERRLARLGREGRAQMFERVVARLYADLEEYL